jgi:hypothetical protein
LAFQQIPQCVEVHINARQDNVPVVNRFYVNVGSATPSVEFDDLFAVIDAWITGSLAPQMTNK